MMTNATDTAQNQDKDATPVGQLDEESLINEINKNLKLGRNHWAKWRGLAKEDYDFYSGNQWDNDDIVDLQEQNRPVVTFNRVLRTINAVAGLEIQNRQEVRYTPILTEQAGVNETLTNAKKWASENCNQEDEESEAFQDALICGMGWINTTMDYEIEPEGQIIVKRIDPFEMVIDPNSKERNFKDATWVAHIKQLTKRELLAMWPHATDITTTQFWLDNDNNEHDATEAPYYKNDQSDKNSKPASYVVVHYQWWERINIIRAVDPHSGKMIDMEVKKFLGAQELMARQGINIPFTRGYKRYYRQAFLCGNKLLEPASNLTSDSFTFLGITGLRAKNEGTWFGLVRLMKDPQRWANKWLSQIQYILNTSAKSGYLAERGAITNVQEFEETAAITGTVNILNDGALSGGKIQAKSPPAYPEGLDRLLQYALTAINDTTGVSLEMIGMTDRDQPIGLEETRKRSGISVLAPFFDALRLYRKKQGHLMAYYIQKYIADGRLIRVVGQDGVKYVPLLRDELTYKYDITVDDAPTSPNMKERTFMMLQQVLPLLLQAGIPVPPEVLDYAPFPDALAQKWKQMILQKQQNPMGQQMQQIQAQLAQLSVAEKQALIQKLQSETAKNYGQAHQAHATGADEAALAMQKLHHNNLDVNQQMTHAQDIHQANMQKMATDQQIRQQGFMHDQNRKDSEFAMNQARKDQESQNAMQLKAMQAQNQLNQGTNQ